MSRQINFYGLSCDAAMLCKWLHSLGACAFQKNIVQDTANLEMVDLTNFTRQEIGGHTLCITLPSVLDQVILEKSIRLGGFHLVPGVSPIIEFCLPTDNVDIDSCFCGNARFYYCVGYDGRNGWVAFPTEVTKLYESIVRQLKKKFLVRYGKSKWVTHNVAKMLTTAPPAPDRPLPADQS